jgi:4-azaleucine resistance transporter AzlC
MDAWMRRELRAGITDAFPVMVSVAAWGLTWGGLARQAGLWPWEVTLMSAIMSAGASQFAALPLVVAGAPAPLVMLLVYVVNLRHYLMAASLAPYVRHTPWWARVVMAHGISDPAYALTIARWRTQLAHSAYFIGCAGGINGAWLVSSGLGAFFGSILGHPDRYGLDFACPAVYLALLVPQVRDHTTLRVACSSGALAFLGASLLPGHWSIVAAGLGGSLLGALADGEPAESES